MEIKRNDIISLLYQESELAMKQHLKEVIIKGSLDYWTWKEFTIRSLNICIYIYKTLRNYIYIYFLFKHVFKFLRYIKFFTYNIYSIFGTHLRLISQLASESEEILFVNHNLLTTLRWFSVGSNQTIAHWTFFCPPDGKFNTFYTK